MNTLFALLLAVGFSTTPETEIKKMAGCYEVTFKFEETWVLPGHPTHSEPHVEEGLEWVEVDFDSADRIDLQHILLTAMGPIKHWRQEWRKSPRFTWDFLGREVFSDLDSPLKWIKSAPLPSSEMWGQRVLQVDDSPRYDCVAPWVFENGSGSWACSSAGPLPRREFSHRSDYDILFRGNKHYSDSQGWYHEQKNRKIQSKDGTIVALEKGINSYVRVPDDRCQESRLWWSDHKNVWHFIQKEWESILEKDQTLKIKPAVGGKPLWRALAEWARDHRTETLSDVHLKSLRDLIKEYRD